MCLPVIGVFLCGRYQEPAGTVYFLIAIPQKEVCIAVPGGPESIAAIASNTLSAFYMKM